MPAARNGGGGGRRGMFRVSVAGVEQVRKALERSADDTNKAVGAALYEIGNNVMTEAKQQAPLDLGTLAGSGYVTLPQNEGRAVYVELGFGGAAAAYAVVQHERPPYKNQSTPGRKPKFLEDPLNEQAGSFQREMVSRTERARARHAGATQGPHPTTPDGGGT